jgi:hypothetical protein
MPRKTRTLSEEIIEKFLAMPDMERALLLRFLIATQRGLSVKDAVSRGVKPGRTRTARPTPVPAGE